ncbi:MAG: winged helix-turn-helix transcriptional regulator [Armatimonadetes bacterium]|nr:winged helix-turn-helix transcriptional regulator [Armatimonadota bacterium]
MSIAEPRPSALAETCPVPCFNVELVDQIRASLPNEAVVRRRSELHGALSDPWRLKILLALAYGELCVCDIGHVLGRSPSAVSHQLRLLRSLSLVERRSDGKMVYYSLADEGRKLIADHEG